VTRHAGRVLIGALLVAALAAWVVPPLRDRLQVSGAAGTAARLAWHAAHYAAILGIVFGMVRLHGTARARWAIPSLLLLLTVLLRFPFWFPSILNADEGEMIVMGQDLLDGHLPFTSIWDVKPPGAVAVMSALVAAGRHVVTVRIGGAVLLFVGAWLLATRPTGRGSIWAAALLLVFVSAAQTGQATVAEHLVLVPLAALLVIALRQSYVRRDMIALGLLLGAAILIRTNLVLLIPALIGLVFARTSQPKPESLMWLAGGLAAPVVVTILVYAVAGHLDALWRGMLVVPFTIPTVSIAGMPFAIGALALEIARQTVGRAGLLWIAAAAGLAFALRRRLEPWSRDAWSCAALLVATLISILAMSASEPRYLIQAMPFLAWLGGGAIARALSRDAKTWAAPIAVGLILPLMGTPGQYADLAAQLRRGEGFFADDGHQLARYLRAHGATGNYVYTLNETNVSAWMAGACHAARFADADQPYVEALVRAFAGEHATTETERLHGFTRRPAFVVLAGDTDLPESAWQALRRDYRRITTIGRHIVFQRLGPASVEPDAC
jgi:hypothetical protein